MMDDEEYGRTLHAAVLRELGIEEPPFHLKIESYVGSVNVSLRDARKELNDFGEGQFVWGLDLTGCGDENIGEKAKEAADILRPHLRPTV
jgi:hypothetical protein